MDNAIVLINTTTNRVFENLNTTNYSRKEPKQSNMDRLTPPKKENPKLSYKKQLERSSRCAELKLRHGQQLVQEAHHHLPAQVSDVKSACFWILGLSLIPPKETSSYSKIQHQMNASALGQLRYSLQNYIFQCNLKYVIHNDQRKDWSVQFCMHFKRIALCVLKEKLFKR